jgi:maleylpyruvate isomerase
MRLYSYWRSSSSWRVRIALEHKGLPYEIVPVNLIAEGGGEQHTPDHVQRNPLEQVPVLEVGGRFLSQSVAIMELLEELHPAPPMLPKDPWARAEVRRMVETVVSGIQPMQNPGTTKRVKQLGGDEKTWASHYVSLGLEALERYAKDTAGRFSVGDTVTFADACLVPQLYSARRFAVALEPYPTLLRVEAECLALAAFQMSHPQKHPGAAP